MRKMDAVWSQWSAVVGFEDRIITTQAGVKAQRLVGFEDRME